MDGAVRVRFRVSTVVMADNSPTDPGPRGGNAGAGGQIANLTVKEAKFFSGGFEEFVEVQSVTGSVADTEAGLGPRFNSNSCASCHAHPAIGGTSPAINPQVSVAPPGEVDRSQVSKSSARMVRFARFVSRRWRCARSVHDRGLPGTPGNCTLSQPNFAGGKTGEPSDFASSSRSFGARPD